MTILEQKFVFFDSKQTLTMNENPSYFNMVLEPIFFSIDAPNVYYKIWLNSVVLRNDFNNINPLNNIVVKDGTTIALNQGKPDIEDIVADLSNHGIDVSYDEDTNYLTFHTDTPYTLDFTSTNSCADILGFIEGQTYTITDGFVAPKQVSLGVNETLYITSNIVRNNFEISFGDTSISKVMCFIPNLAPKYEILNHYDPVGEQSIIDRNTKGLQNITFQICDTAKKPLTLNSYWTASVCVQYLIDYEPDILRRLETLNDSITRLMELERRKLLIKSLDKKSKPKK